MMKSQPNLRCTPLGLLSRNTHIQRLNERLHSQHEQRHALDSSFQFHDPATNYTTTAITLTAAAIPADATAATAAAGARWWLLATAAIAVTATTCSSAARSTIRTATASDAALAAARAAFRLLLDSTQLPSRLGVHIVLTRTRRRPLLQRRRQFVRWKHLPGRHEPPMARFGHAHHRSAGLNRPLLCACRVRRAWFTAL